MKTNKVYMLLQKDAMDTIYSITLFTRANLMNNRPVKLLMEY